MQGVKEFRKTLLLAAICAAPITAANAAGQLDVYYTPYTTLKSQDSSGNDYNFDKGDGYGAKGRFDIVDRLFVNLEYERNTFDALNINGTGIGSPDFELKDKTEEYRAGLGYGIGSTPFYVNGEYIRLDSKLHAYFPGGTTQSQNDTSEGWGAHMGAQGKVLSDYVTLNAEIGYVDIGDLNGLEVLGGFGVNVTQHVGVFADYRFTSLTGSNSAPDTKLEEARVGIRATF